MPAQLDWDDLDAITISAFLNHLESERHNTTRTRNVRGRARLAPSVVWLVSSRRARRDAGPPPKPPSATGSRRG